MYAHDTYTYMIKYMCVFSASKQFRFCCLFWTLGSDEWRWWLCRSHFRFTRTCLYHIDNGFRHGTLVGRHWQPTDKMVRPIQIACWSLWWCGWWYIVRLQFRGRWFLGVRDLRWRQVIPAVCNCKSIMKSDCLTGTQTCICQWELRVLRDDCKSNCCFVSTYMYVCMNACMNVHRYECMCL